MSLPMIQTANGSGIISITLDGDTKGAELLVKAGLLEVAVPPFDSGARSEYLLALPPLSDNQADPLILQIETGSHGPQRHELNVSDFSPPWTTAKDMLDHAIQLESSSQPREALALLTTIVALHPDNFEALLRIARLWWTLGDHNRAKSFGLLAFSLQPRNHRAAVHLARIALKEKRPELALFYLEVVTTKHKSYAEACSLRAQTLTDLERRDEAADWMYTFLKMRPDNQGHRIRYAKLLIQLSRYDQAEAEYQRLEADSPGKYSAQLSQLTKRRLSPAWERLPRQYSGAMTRKAAPACLASGSSPVHLAVAKPLAMALSEHFGVQTPIITAKGKLSCDEAPSSRMVEDPREYELVFLLPEFLVEALGSDVEVLPVHTTLCSFQDHHQMSPSAPPVLLVRYSTWLRGLICDEAFDAAIRKWCRPEEMNMLLF